MTTSKACVSRSARGAGDLGDLGVGRVAQHPAVGQHHQRQLRLGARPGEQLASLVGVRQAEGVRDRALLEDLPQLVGPARPRLADDVDGLRDDAPIPRPLEQEARDRLVEDLVGRGRRLGHVVVDAPEGHRRRGSRRRSARPPRRPAGTSSARLACGCSSRTRSSSSLPVVARERGGREHQRDVLAAARELRQQAAAPRPDRPGTRRDSRGVPPDELGLDVVEGVPVLVDGEQQRLAHRPVTLTGRRAVPQRS